MRAGEELGGPNAIGRPGDLVLENDEVVFVVDRIGSSSGFAESGGNVVDAADARARKDELGQQFTYFGKFPRQGVYDDARERDGRRRQRVDRGEGPRALRAHDSSSRRATRCSAPDRALLLETTLENTGDAPVGGLTLGDAIQWGGAEKIAPGKARGFKGPSSGPYVGGVGRFTSYAITSADGAIEGTSGSTWTDTTQRDAAGSEEKSRSRRARAPGYSAHPGRRRASRLGEPRERADAERRAARRRGRHSPRARRGGAGRRGCGAGACGARRAGRCARVRADRGGRRGPHDPRGR